MVRLGAWKQFRAMMKTYSHKQTERWNMRQGEECMSLSLNMVQIAGRIGQDPECKTVGDTTVANFSVAITSKYKGKEETTWLDVEAWRDNAELISKYFKKGTAIFVSGRLRQDSWEAKDGGKRTRIKLVADRVSFVESKAKGEESHPVRASE